jgi:hypothetical protein
MDSIPTRGAGRWTSFVDVARRSDVFFVVLIRSLPRQPIAQPNPRLASEKARLQATSGV